MENIGPIHRLYRGKNYRKCIEAARAALAIVPKDSPKALKLQYLIGDALLDLKKYEEAILEYGRILSMNPSDIAYANRALARWELGDYRGALKDYNQAIRLERSNQIAHRGAGEMYLKLDQPKRAAIRFRSALRLKPDYSAALTGLGISLFQIGKWAQAYRCFKDALRLDPRDSLAKKGLDVLETELREG